jgi:hypothetical protein
MRNLPETIQAIFRENPLEFSLMFSLTLFLAVLSFTQLSRFVETKRREGLHRQLIDEIDRRERQKRNRL